MRLSVMRLSEKPQTVKAERPDDRLLGIGFDGCRLGGCPEKPKTVKAKRPDDRLLIIAVMRFVRIVNIENIDYAEGRFE